MITDNYVPNFNVCYSITCPVHCSCHTLDTISPHCVVLQQICKTNQALHKYSCISFHSLKCSNWYRSCSQKQDTLIYLWIRLHSRSNISIMTLPSYHCCSLQPSLQTLDSDIDPLPFLNVINFYSFFIFLYIILYYIVVYYDRSCHVLCSLIVYQPHEINHNYIPL